MKKIILISISTLLIVIGAFAYYAYKQVSSLAISEESIIYIKTDSTFDELLKQLEPKIKNIEIFKKLAKVKAFTTPRFGKYTLKKGLTVNGLVNKLRVRSESVKVQFNNQYRIEDLAGRIAQQIEADSLSILNEMKEPTFLKKNNFTEKTVLCMYIPNKYDVYWNTSPKNFKTKMLHYYNKFWNTKRSKKAKQLGLTHQEVITLASIVQQETAKVSERPIVAGLYLNRYKIKQELQADPTVIYALKEKNGHDKVYKRVIFKDLKIDSPYNTYKNVGLPPGPIAMPDISSIDAVLTPAKHKYIFMCASTKKLGYHIFAVEYSDHLKNAAAYTRWITKIGIKR